MEQIKAQIDAHNGINYKELAPDCIQVYPASSAVRNTILVTAAAEGGYTIEVWVVNPSNNFGFYPHKDLHTTDPIATILEVFANLNVDTVEAQFNALYD